jgi:hypothetical protein
MLQYKCCCPNTGKEGGLVMIRNIFSFILSVTASVAAYYICK